MSKELDRIKRILKEKPKSAMTRYFEKIWEEFNDPDNRLKKKLEINKQEKIKNKKTDLGL